MESSEYSLEAWMDDRGEDLPHGFPNLQGDPDAKPQGRKQGDPGWWKSIDMKSGSLLSKGPRHTVVDGKVYFGHPVSDYVWQYLYDSAHDLLDEPIERYRRGK